MSKKLSQSTLLVGFLTLLSRVLGFIRDAMLARFFGAGASMDGFLVAFRIPNFMRRLFAEGAFAQVFVPELQRQQEHNNFTLFWRTSLGVISVYLWSFAAIAMLCSGLLVALFAPGFYHDITLYDSTSVMLRITMLYVPLVTITAMLASLLNSYHHFGAAAFAPSLLNIIMIIGILCSVYFSAPLLVVAWSVALAGLVQCLFLAYYVRALRIPLIPRFDFKNLIIVQMLKGLPLALLGASVIQLSFLLETIFATFLTHGSLSWLYYADRLNQFPLGIFGVAIATVILPSLCKVAPTSQAFFSLYQWSMRWVCLMVLPASVALIILAKPIVITLFYGGAFSMLDVNHTVWALMIFALGLYAFVMVKVLTSIFYAHQQKSIPIIIGIIGLSLNLVMNILIVILWNDVTSAFLALAASTTVTAIVIMLTLWVVLYWRNLRHLKTRMNYGFYSKIIIATLMMSLAVYIMAFWFFDWLSRPLMINGAILGLIIMTGMAIYFACVWLFGIRKHHFTISPER